MTRLVHPIAKARGLGSAKSGAHHWWVQRTTAVTLMVLAPWFVWFVLSLLGSDAMSVRLALAQPFTATLMAVFVLSLFWHTQLGLQVVIEDYVHTRWLELTLQLAVRFACLLAATASVVAIGRIVFTA